MNLDVNPTGEEDIWQADLRLPVDLWDEFEEWREGMAIPEGHIYFTGAGVHRMQFVGVTERQAMLFKLRWA